MLGGMDTPTGLLATTPVVTVPELVGQLGAIVGGTPSSTGGSSREPPPLLHAMRHDSPAATMMHREIIG
jgi:hypothetical protein